jgi:hypothetical protein
MQNRFRAVPSSTLIEEFKKLLDTERFTVAEIVEYVREIDRRQLYLEHGYTSLFSFLTDGLGYPVSRQSCSHFRSGSWHESKFEIRQCRKKTCGLSSRRQLSLEMQTYGENVRFKISSGGRSHKISLGRWIK